MPFTMFTLAMLLICILCIGKEAFRGFVRGPLRALVSLCAVVLSIICSVFLSRALGGVFAKVITEIIASEVVVNNVAILAEISSLNATVSFFVQVVINVLAFIIVFPISRWIIKAVIGIVIKHNLQKMGGETSAESIQDKLLGAVVGGFCGMIAAVAITAPFVGTLHLLGDVADLAERADENALTGTYIQPPELDAIDEYASDSVGNFCYMVGEELIYKHVTVADFDGKHVSAIEEIKYIKETAEFALDVAGCFYEDNDTFDFSKSTDVFYENFEKSVILQSVALEVLPEFSSAWLHGEDFIGIPMPDFKNVLRPMISELLLNCSDVNVYSITPMTKTLLNVVGVLIECDIKADSKSNPINYCLLVAKLYEVFENSPGMENVTLKLESVASTVIGNLFAEHLTDAMRATMVQSVANQATQILEIVSGSQARSEAIGEMLLKDFEGVGISVDPSFCELMAGMLVKIGEENNDQISPTDVAMLFGMSEEG